MGKGFIVSFVAITMASRPVSAHEGEVLVFEPSSAWAIVDQDQNCALRRTFLAGNTSLIVQLNSRGLGNYLDVTLASSDLKTDGSQVTYQFLPDTELREPKNPKVGSLGGELEGVSFVGSMRQPVSDSQSMTTIWPVAERQQREATTTALQVAGVFERPVLLRTGAMGAPMDAMRSCMDKLYVSWGFDPRIADAVAFPVSRLHPYDLARRANNAYPRKFVRSGISATVRVVVSVAPDGRPKHCHAHNLVPYPEFEEVACETVMRHARYEPARNADGNAVEDIDSFAMTFSPN